MAQVRQALDVGDTGYYGSVIWAGVIAFQRRNGLLVDGIVGPPARRALFGARDASTSTSRAAAAAQPSAKGGVNHAGDD